MRSTFAGNTSESSSSQGNRPCACFTASTISEPSRDCRIEAHASPPAAARCDFDVDKQAVDGCCADGQNTSAISEAKLQSAMLLRADSSVGIISLSRLPRTRSDANHRALHRVLDCRAISTFALRRGFDPVRISRLVQAKCTPRVLTMPARRRTQRVQNPPLLRPSGRPVTLRHRRHHLAPQRSAGHYRRRSIGLFARHRPVLGGANALPSLAAAEEATMLRLMRDIDLI